MAYAIAFDEGHEIKREKVCVVCYRKARKKLSEREVNIIQNHVIRGYDVNNSDFPAGICGTCEFVISKLNAGKNVNLPNIDYDPLRPKTLRSLEKCDCKICTVAECKLTEAVKTKKGPEDHL